VSQPSSRNALRTHRCRKSQEGPRANRQRLKYQPCDGGQEDRKQGPGLGECEPAQVLTRAYRTCMDTPTGQGVRKRITSPTATEMAAGRSFAPTAGEGAACQVRGSGATCQAFITSVRPDAAAARKVGVLRAQRCSVVVCGRDAPPAARQRLRQRPSDGSAAAWSVSKKPGLRRRHRAGGPL
jgi:hypothetical protein